MEKKLYTYIDLFAGAGGLSEGFIQQKYNPIAHVEMDANACFTLKTRMLYHYLSENNKIGIYANYLRKKIQREDLYAEESNLLKTIFNVELKPENIQNIFSGIENLLPTNIAQVDLIIGGPPCQAYSIVGRARVREEKKKLEDPRRFLYRLYIQFLIKFQPKVFVFENVPGILNVQDHNKVKFIDKIRNEFKEVGYNMSYEIIDTSLFGVPQKRKRVFIIGWKEELPLSYPNFEDKKVPNYWTINSDLFSDLPLLKAGEKWESFEYAASPSQYLLETKIRNENDLLTWHITRPTNENDKQIYKLAIEKWQDGHKRLSYKELPEVLKTQKNENGFSNRFSVVEGDLPYSHTVVAHIAQDGHYYIHPDINQLRSITVREAARLQSFPDSYYFEGNRTSVFKQIGNAVPPLFASIIAKKIKLLLDQCKAQQFTPKNTLSDLQHVTF